MYLAPVVVKLLYSDIAPLLYQSELLNHGARIGVHRGSSLSFLVYCAAPRPGLTQFPVNFILNEEGATK